MMEYTPTTEEKPWEVDLRQPDKMKVWHPPTDWSPGARKATYGVQIGFLLVKIVWLLGALVLFGSCAVAAAVGGGS